MIPGRIDCENRQRPSRLEWPMVRPRIPARTRDARQSAMLTGSDPRDIFGIYFIDVMLWLDLDRTGEEEWPRSSVI